MSNEEGMGPVEQMKRFAYLRVLGAIFVTSTSIWRRNKTFWGSADFCRSIEPKWKWIVVDIWLLLRELRTILSNTKHFLPHTSKYHEVEELLWQILKNLWAAVEPSLKWLCELGTAKIIFAAGCGVLAFNIKYSDILFVIHIRITFGQTVEMPDSILHYFRSVVEATC